MQSFIIQRIFPEVKTPVQELEDELASTVYDSYWKKPIGKAPEHKDSLPCDVDIVSTTFGDKTKYEMTVGEVVNPPKSIYQVIDESAIGHELYTSSHNDYFPGEQIKRNYSPNFSEELVFGKPTPHDNSGREAALAFKWCNPSFIPVLQSDVNKRKDFPLGESKKRTNLDPYFPHGKKSDVSDFSVGDLLYGKSEIRTFVDNLKASSAYVKGLRTYIKDRTNYIISDIYTNFRFYDKCLKGSISLEDAYTVLERYKIPLIREDFEKALTFFGLISEDNKSVNYKKLTNMINWQRAFPTPASELKPKSPESEPPQKDEDLDLCFNMRPAGVPSIRSDLKKPKVEKFTKNINYGDEENVACVICPSLADYLDLDKSDYLKPRSLQEIFAIFSAVGTGLPREFVEKLYKEGDSVESFRQKLDFIASKAWLGSEKKKQVVKP